MNESTKSSEMFSYINLKTEDNQLIKAVFYPNPNSNKGLILVHQYSKNKSSWIPWIKLFQETHNVLAIDLRGHGESSGKYEEFIDDDFINMKLDLKAAVNYLKTKNISENNISFIGASIGANTVQNYISDLDTNKYDKAVLLSPGINYKGIKLNLKDNSTLIIVSKEDSYSFNSVKELEKSNKKSTYLYLNNKGHGTNMLDEDLVKKIINYLNNKQI